MKGYVENAKVERIFDTAHGAGVAVVESEMRGEREFKSWATLWFKSRPENVHVGDLVNASGFVSAKVRTYEAPSGSKTVADVSLNGARIQSVVPGSAPVEEPPAEDAWADEGPAW